MTIDLAAARQSLLELVDSCGVEHVSLETSWGRLLAEDVTANADFPAFDRSLFDGYAVRCEDVKNASVEQPAVLNQIDYIPAGSVGRYPLGPGQTVRIMTGASLPVGADGVVRLEDTIQEGTDIYIRTDRGIQKNIGRKGTEIRQGEIILRRERIVDGGAMSALAILGKNRPLVYKRPRVAVLATGSEIVEVSEEPPAGKIRNSNTYMLLAQIKEAGGEPILLGHVRDETVKIVEKLRAVSAGDLIVTTGGVSAGDFDLMRQVFTELGVPVMVERVAIRPGMHVLAGNWQGKLLVALSGSPAAASVAFEVLIRPLIRKMAGSKDVWRQSVKAVLQAGLPKKTVNRRFVWARCCWQEHEWVAEPLLYARHSTLKSMIWANALIDVPADSPPLLPGETVTVLLLGRQVCSGLGDGCI